QLLQDQQQQQVAVAAAQLKQQIQQTHSVGTQVVHSGSQTIAPQTIQPTPQPTQMAAQASTVSVITSTASAVANMKPFMSRSNGMRNFQPVNIVIDEDIKTEPSTNLLADEKLESSPELPSSSNSNDSVDIPKNIVVPGQLANSTTTTTITAGSKVIVENHSVSVNTTTTTTTTTMVNNKPITKFNDLDAELSESSSNQSLPVISIKDTENNLPACELTNEDSSGMFEDFLMNGKTNTPIDDSITNNLMSEDSLLNNLIMGEELANSMISPENTTSEAPSSLNEFPLNNAIKMECSDTNDGALRIGEKGLELISKDELQRGFKAAYNEKSVICSNKKNFTAKNSIEPTVPMKVDAGIETKPEFLAPLAANLYAALAADVLGDIDGMDEDEVLPPPPPPPPPQPLPTPVQSYPNVQAAQSPVVEPHQQLYLTTGPNSRQILVATTPSGALTSRTVSIMGAGGQQYIVTLQTALVQGQPQTVLVTQTAQQQGTGAKTIIILQNQPSLAPQSVQATNQSSQKMIMQKLPNTSTQQVVAAPHPGHRTTIVSAQQSQGTQISATQFFTATGIQCTTSASAQTLPTLNTTSLPGQQIPTVFSIGNTNLTPTLVTSQVNQAAQTTAVSQMIAPATAVSQQTITQTSVIAPSIAKAPANIAPAGIVQAPASPAPAAPQSRQVKPLNQVKPIQNTVPIAAMSPSMGPAAPAAVPATPPVSYTVAQPTPVAAVTTAATVITTTASVSTTVSGSVAAPKPGEGQGAVFVRVEELYEVS
ncbi:AT-rich interactive domain-containing protein 2, partial [Sarracenia purpurea var. burkii]